MVRPPSVYDEEKLKKGPWTPEEDQKLVDCINKHGHASWRAVPKLAGLNRCGKSCRLRWKNYLQPDIKRGKFSDDEEKLIIRLHSILGNKWSKIATHLPGRTDNEIKNFWNTNLSKKLLQMGIDPKTHKPRTDINHLSQLLSSSQFGNFIINPLDLLKLRTNTTQLANFHVLQNLLQILNTPTLPSLNHNGTTPNIGSHNFFPNSLNPTFISPKLPASFQEIVGSSMLNVNDIGDFDLQSLDANNDGVITSNMDCYNHVNVETQDYSLPKLLSASASPEKSCFVNHLETNNDLSNVTTPPHISNMFEDLERLINEGTSESYWNDILINDLLD